MLLFYKMSMLLSSTDLNAFRRQWQNVSFLMIHRHVGGATVSKYPRPTARLTLSMLQGALVCRRPPSLTCHRRPCRTSPATRPALPRQWRHRQTKGERTVPAGGPRGAVAGAGDMSQQQADERLAQGARRPGCDRSCVTRV